MSGLMALIWRRLRSVGQKVSVVFGTSEQKGVGSSAVTTPTTPETSTSTDWSVDSQFPLFDNIERRPYNRLLAEQKFEKVLHQHRHQNLEQPLAHRRLGPYGTMTYRAWTLSSPPPKTTARWN